MAWFTYECAEHGQFKASLVKREVNQPCPKCQAVSKPILKTGTISVVERLDNGVMARAVERLHNIEEIMNDRADKHSEDNNE